MQLHSFSLHYTATSTATLIPRLGVFNVLKLSLILEAAAAEEEKKKKVQL